jgi:hypothetical protein
MARKREVESLKITFSKPYTFEEKTYDEVDLSGLEKLNGEALEETQSALDAMGVAYTMPEINYTYIMLLAARATALPLEFFEGLPMKDALKVKAKVQSYFFAD